MGLLDSALSFLVGGPPDVPPAPDYAGAAKATAEADLQMAREALKANRPKQITPWGTTNWTQNPDGTWVQQVDLDPTAQQALDNQQLIQGGMSRQALSMLPQVQSAVGNGFDMSKISEMPDLGFGAVEGIQDSIMERMQPLLDRRRNNMEAQLATQGITRGSEAWNEGQQDLTFGENDAYAQAVQKAMAAYDTITGRQVQGRQQNLQEQAWLRSLPINELNAVLTGNQVQAPQFSNFTNQSTTRGADMFGAANAAGGYATDVYNQQAASRDNMISGLFSLGSSAAKASDIRVKENIAKIGVTPGGFNVYSFNYIWDDEPQVGVMAQEVEQVLPEAVTTINGVKHVYYDMIH
jgi:hypothetical protein